MGLKRRRFPNSGLFLIERKLSPIGTSTFSDIPQEFEDLRLIVSGVGSGGPQDINIRFNGDSATNYDWMRTYGSGTTTTTGQAQGASAGTIGRLGGGTPQGGSFAIDIPHYRSGMRKHATAVSTSWDGDGAGQSYIMMHGIRWRSAVPITSITLVVASNIDNGQASLYGIR